MGRGAYSAKAPVGSYHRPGRCTCRRMERRQRCLAGRRANEVLADALLQVHQLHQCDVVDRGGPKIRAVRPALAETPERSVSFAL